MRSLHADGADALARQMWSQDSDLRRLVNGKLGKGIRKRLDVSDVLQDAYVDAQRQLAAFLRNPLQSVRVWLRLVTSQRANQLLRAHVLAQRRSTNAEQRLADTAGGPCPLNSISADQSSAESRLLRNERATELQLAFSQLSPSDQQIVRLRSFEGLSNVEAAAKLQISVASATKRYIRALSRLSHQLKISGMALSNA